MVVSIKRLGSTYSPLSHLNQKQVIRLLNLHMAAHQNRYSSYTQTYTNTHTVQNPHRGSIWTGTRFAHPPSLSPTLHLISLPPSPADPPWLHTILFQVEVGVFVKLPGQSKAALENYLSVFLFFSDCICVKNVCMTLESFTLKGFIWWKTKMLVWYPVRQTQKF